MVVLVPGAFWNRSRLGNAQMHTKQAARNQVD